MISNVFNSKIISSPFNPNNRTSYGFWRDNKLQNYPENIGDIVVEINDPRKLSYVEYQKLLQVCRKTNMVLYSSKTGCNPDTEIPLAIGRRFVGQKLDHNWLADDTGISSLTVATQGIRQQFIPYTNRAIQWHTDGYYNSQQQQIRALFLHVVQRAALGGENALMDHEIAYILLREKNPDYIRALMEPTVMTIPARIEEGKIARAEESGPIFSVDASGDLHMRYTIRTNNVIWSNDVLTQEALEYLQKILNGYSPFIIRGLLEPGMGLISNNILHNREAFTDNEIHERHFYRVRYFNRIKGTSLFDNI
ncbi:MAG: TauD/TfdA family dioxygenase [Thiohalomonadales bacterium]